MYYALKSTQNAQVILIRAVWMLRYTYHSLLPVVISEIPRWSLLIYMGKYDRFDIYADGFTYSHIFQTLAIIHGIKRYRQTGVKRA